MSESPEQLPTKRPSLRLGKAVLEGRNDSQTVRDADCCGFDSLGPNCFAVRVLWQGQET